MHAPSRPGAVTAEFRGPRAASGPLTFGQRNVLMWIGEDCNKWSSVIPLFQPVPPGLGVADVAAALAVLVSRHESLRTRYLTGGGEPVQRVARHGEVAAEVCELDGDDTEFLMALEARLSGEPFDMTADLPVRAAIVTRGGAPVLAVLVICHIAVDVGSVAVLGRELTSLLAGVSPERLGDPGAQPLEVAAAEGSPLGRRRAAAALRHWEATLSAAPLRLPVPAQPGADAAIPRRVRMISPAGARALDRLAETSPAGRSATVLAAVAAVLGLRTGTGTALFASVSGNRFHPGLGGLVGSLAQDALVSFSAAGGTFRELVTRAWSAQLAAYRHSRFDPDGVWAVIDAVQHRRGAYFGRDWVFNDVGAHLDSARPAGEETSLDWTDVPHVPVMLFFRLIGVRGALDLELHFDARYFPPRDVEAMLLGVEKLLVASAEGEVRLDDLGAVTGCSEIARGPGWVRDGSSWVELAAVSRLLAAAANLPCAVTVDGGAAVGGALVGYVAGEAGTTPQKLHAACVAELAGRPTAITPSWYVICGSAPVDLSDLDAWRALPVLAEGDGR